MRKTSRLEMEAQRMQAGKRHRVVRLDLKGAALETWETLEKGARQKGIDPDGLVTLLLLHGHQRVEKVLAGLGELSVDAL
jgi:hypothetical protein